MDEVKEKSKNELYDEAKAKRDEERKKKEAKEIKKAQKAELKKKYKNPAYSTTGKIICWILILSMIAVVVFSFVFLLIKNFK